MRQVQAADKKIGDTQKQKVIVVQEPAGVPGDHKNAARDEDAENLGQAVKKEVIIAAGQIKPEQDQQARGHDYIPAETVRMFFRFFIGETHDIGTSRAASIFI